jgi:chromosome partitioning protein
MGGVGKSTMAVRLAAHPVKRAPTILLDSDPNRSVCGWALNGSPPFEIIPLPQFARRSRELEHFVIDTNAGLQADELKEIVEGCDLLTIPSTPDALSYQALIAGTPDHHSPAAIA